MDATRASSRVARFLSHLLPVANAHSTNLTPIPTNGHATTNFTLSSHVLDTNLGVPAKGMPVRLEKQISAQPLQYKLLSRHETNADGRVPMKDFGEFVEAGIYRVTFDTAAYFKKLNMPSDQYFYPEVQVEFKTQLGQHYHIPLLISPYGYSTYRGS